ncbi:MAG: radical SAM/SPASM domain-containing protein [archaeon]
MNKLLEFKIEVTQKCPLCCIHCSSESTPDCQSEVPRDKCFEIISEAKDLGAQEVSFSGGEPLIYPFINECVEFATSKSLAVQIYSSGNIDNFYGKIAELKKLGLKKMIFSLYSPFSEEHERITRIKGSHTKTLNAISETVKADIDAEVHFVALSDNYRKIPDVAELARKMGAKRISILRFVPQGRGSLIQDKQLTRAQFLELKEMIETLRESGHNIRTGSPFNFLLLNDSPSCKAATDRLIITPYLSIHPCDAFKQIQSMEMVGTNDYSDLNIHSLKECWEKSPFLNKVRDEIKNPTTASCNQCQIYNGCLSGCLAQKFIRFNKIEKNPDPSCMKNFLINNNGNA